MEVRSLGERLLFIVGSSMPKLSCFAKKSSTAWHSSRFVAGSHESALGPYGNPHLKRYWGILDGPQTRISKISLIGYSAVVKIGGDIRSHDCGVEIGGKV